jgi:hypothetical protein
LRAVKYEPKRKRRIKKTLFPGNEAYRSERSKQ